MHLPPHRIILLIACLATLPSLSSAQDADAAERSHPRLLLSQRELPRIRAACGLPTVEVALDAAAPHTDTLLALRMRMGGPFGPTPLPGEVLSAAFLHFLAPDDVADAIRVQMIGDALQSRSPVGPSAIELALALDWTWDALDPAVRESYLVDAQRRLAPLEPGDSPLEPAKFRDKLAGLALAIAVSEADQPGAAWAITRRRILQAARDYFSLHFPTFVAWRGRVPTSPSAAADEELLTVLAVELAGHVGPDLGWKSYADSVGRWLEHYVVSETPHPVLQHQFLRDDGDSAPPGPLAEWHSLQPLTAALIAARCDDPAAVRLADAAAREARDSADPALLQWRWLPLVWPTAAVRAADPQRFPAARELGGAVVMRGGAGAHPVVVWIEAGQPFLRRGQHFDAGHFLVRADGHLVVEGGGDIALEAISSKDGRQGLGDERDAFDFAQYAAATIAHNAMIFWDAGRTQRWYGQRFRPIGGQVPREGVCRDFSTPLTAQGRQSASLLAYGHRDGSAYAALDLTPAYDDRVVKQYLREFVLIDGHTLLVIDRAALAGDRIEPTWTLQLPAPPAFDGIPLPPDRQVRGPGPDSGVWRDNHLTRLAWTDHDGHAALTPLWPPERQVTVVGGPAARLKVPEGPLEGVTYVGGGPGTFERLIQPVDRPGAANAWYQLGRPTALGRYLGHMAHWGRVEIEPAARSSRVLLVNALQFGAAARDGAVSAASGTTGLRIKASAGGRTSVLEFALGLRPGGRLLDANGEEQWALPDRVEPDDPLVRLAGP